MGVDIDMEWKEIKDGKPVEEGVEIASEEKPEVAENTTEVKPEVKAQEPVEQKAEVKVEAPAEKAPEAKTEAPAEKEPDKKVEAPAEKEPEKKAEAPADEAPKVDKKEATTDDKAEALVEDKKPEEKAEDKSDAAPEKTPEEIEAEKKANRAKRLKVYSKAVFYTLVLGVATIILFFFIGVGVKSTDGPVGYWAIKEASSGDVIMKTEDAEAMGLREIGAFKLNRGGECVITYLGKQEKGKWKQNDSGKIVIKYGEDKKIVAKINEKTGVMTAKDNESMAYKLEK